jgi:hypothetical protein
MKIDPTPLSRWAWFLLLIVPCATALSGCGGKPMVRVRGKVTYKDGSIPQGGVAVVNFTPASDSTAEIRKGATGAIESDGSFEMTTRMPGDGVYLGSYNVAFVVQRNAMDATTSLILPKYNSPSMSGYSVTIDKPKDDLHFEIEPLPGAGGASAAGGDATNPGT